MSDYNTIIVAVDLSEESHQVAKRALAAAGGDASKLHLVHVIEPLSFAYGGDIPLDYSGIQEEIEKQAQEQMTRFASTHSVPAERCHVLMGKPAQEIHQLASQHDADLVVIGSHGRHGLELLFGSTANAVLHGAGCDILAVRVGH